MASGCEALRGLIYLELGPAPVVFTSHCIVMIQSWERASGPTEAQWETLTLIYIFNMCYQMDPCNLCLKITMYVWLLHQLWLQFDAMGPKSFFLMVFWMLYEEVTYETSSVGWVNCFSCFAKLSRRTPSCLLWEEVHVFVCCECVWASSFSLHPFSFKATECCYDNPSWSLLIRSGPQCRHSGNLLALGRQHKIGIIAVDYGAQWATASERFIHPGKRDCAGQKKKTGCLGPSAALPRWAQAWHQWPERTGILDIPTPPQSYPSAPAYSNPPPLRFLFLALPVWMQCLARQVGATATVCMWNKAPLKEKRGSGELHMVPAKSRDGCLCLPLQRPLFCLKSTGVTLLS